MVIKTGAELLNAAIREIEEELGRAPDFFKHRSYKDLSIFASSLQNKLFKQLSFKDKDKLKGQLHTLNSNYVKTFIASAQKGLHLFMRHAEQLKTKEVQKLNEEDAKIFMMREPQNASDPMTLLSALNFINQLVLFKFIQDKHGINLHVHSSKNMRALQPATALSILLNKAPPTQHDALNCLSYPSKENLSTADLKALLNKGKLLWNQGSVDTVCGEGRFSTLVSDISSIMKSSKPEAKHINLYFTHTQQLKAASDSLGVPSGTFDYFGYVGIDGTEKSLLNEKGLTQRQQPKTPLPAIYRPCSGIRAVVFPEDRAYQKYAGSKF